MTSVAAVTDDDASSDGAGPLHPISQQLHEKRTRGERLADLIAHHIGSWRFLIIQTILVLMWIAMLGRLRTESVVSQ